jgi:hypothetical protein
MESTHLYLRDEMQHNLSTDLPKESKNLSKFSDYTYIVWMVVGAVFLLIIQKINEVISGPGGLRGYLMRVTMNLMLMRGADTTELQSNPNLHNSKNQNENPRCDRSFCASARARSRKHYPKECSGTDPEESNTTIEDDNSTNKTLWKTSRQNSNIMKKSTSINANLSNPISKEVIERLIIYSDPYKINNWDLNYSYNVMEGRARCISS